MVTIRATPPGDPVPLRRVAAKEEARATTTVSRTQDIYVKMLFRQERFRKEIDGLPVVHIPGSWLPVCQVAL